MNEAPSLPKIAAIVLAAGMSTRMGRAKALLSWGGSPLVRHQVITLTSQPEITLVVVVVGHRRKEVTDAIQGTSAHTIVNRKYREGRATSLVAGALALADIGSTAVMVVNVDQPLAPEILRPLIRASGARSQSLLRPSYLSKPGHPIILPADIAPELKLATDADFGLRAIVKRHSERISHVAVESELAVLNLNTTSEFDAACARYAPVS